MNNNPLDTPIVNLHLLKVIQEMREVLRKAYLFPHDFENMVHLMKKYEIVLNAYRLLKIPENMRTAEIDNFHRLQNERDELIKKDKLLKDEQKKKDRRFSYDDTATVDYKSMYL